MLSLACRFFCLIKTPKQQSRNKQDCGSGLQSTGHSQDSLQPAVKTNNTNQSPVTSHTNLSSCKDPTQTTSTIHFYNTYPQSYSPF